MSIRYMRWAWDLKLSPVPKLVLLKLTDNANDSGCCFPSIVLISRQCCIGERSVQRAIAELVSLGHVKVEKRFREDGSQTSNRYYLIAGEAGVKLTPPRDPMKTEGVTTSTPQDDPSDTQTTIQPKVSKPSHPWRGWIFPEGLSPLERAEAEKKLLNLDDRAGQQVLDELAARMRAETVRNPLGYLSCLIKRAENGTFTPELAFVEKTRRATEDSRRLDQRRKEKQHLDQLKAAAPVPEKIRSRVATLQKKQSAQKKRRGSED